MAHAIHAVRILVSDPARRSVVWTEIETVEFKATE